MFLVSAHLLSCDIDWFAQWFRNGEVSDDFLLLQFCRLTADFISCGGMGINAHFLVHQFVRKIYALSDEASASGINYLSQVPLSLYVINDLGFFA